MISLGFAGTPVLARDILKTLNETDSFRVDMVLTRPDRPAGRGMTTRSSPVKQYARSHGLTLRQPATPDELRDSRELGDLDLVVVAAYGMIFPRQALSAPRYGCVNVHFSLLPRWRGATPVQHAILSGDTETGISLMAMEEGLDSGPIIDRRVCPVRSDDTTGSLMRHLTDMARAMLPDRLEAYCRDPRNVTPQDGSLATYTRRLGKDSHMIHWRASAVEIERLIRAMQPEPLARAVIAGVTVIIRQATVIDTLASDAPPGTPVGAGDTLDIATGRGILRLLTVQSPGRRPMSADVFLNGRPEIRAARRGPA